MLRNRIVHREDRLEVAVGTMVVARSPDIVSCRGLGSCVALTLYDASQGLGGLAHIMLPFSNGRHPSSPALCADSAVVVLMKKLREKGAVRKELVAKMIGGASMFADDGNSRPRIGAQNIASVRHVLNEEGVRLAGTDVGSDYGRSVRFDLASGMVTIESIGRETREI